MSRLNLFFLVGCLVIIGAVVWSLVTSGL